jgi:hydrogenase nickel incorporation protein HypB
MCATCGCSDLESLGPDHPTDHGHVHAHPHEHGPGHAHAHGHPHQHADPHDHDHPAGPLRPMPPPGRAVTLELELLAKNDRLAAGLRASWAEQRILALNLLGGPGTGKTSLLERTVRMLHGQLPLSVLEGDQETSRDAERVRAAGARAHQINTGTGCHLDAAMVRAGAQALTPESGSVLFVENVGNLVCPALFDLGERAKVVLLSVTEGEDKPLKYPHMFRAAQVLVFTKIDLLPHLDFDLDRCLAHARQVNPRLQAFRTSARTGEGFADWCDWIRAERIAVGARR